MNIEAILKSFLHIFIFILLLTQIQYPQWTNQNPVPDGNDLWSTFFVDDNTGWIVGSSGFIKKTTNAGLDWIQQTSGTTSTLRSVQFINQNTGWICGDGGLILKTTIGGQNWLVLTGGTSQNLVDIHFYDLNIGWVVGDGETILKTTNGGSSWTTQFSGTSFNLNSVDFVDAFIGYAVGTDTDSYQVLLKTTDGGLNWIDKSPVLDMSTNLNAVEFLDANTGYIGGYEGGFQGNIYKTTDGGETWTRCVFMKIEGDEISDLMEIKGDEFWGITSIFFKDSNNGYAVGGGRYKIIRTTTDGGSTWIYKSPYEGIYSGGLCSIYANSIGKGWAIGSSGQIFITEDDGNSWAHILSGSGYPSDDINSVFFINENIGWAAGQRHLDNNWEIILKTTNGGKLWKTQYGLGPGPLRQFYYVTFTDANNGTVVGGGGTILRTTNGGTDWIQQTSGTSVTLYGVTFTDANNGTVVGGGGTIIRTTNGGTDWIQQTSGTTSSLYGVYFTDVNNGIVVGGGGTILRTTNGGTDWTEQTSGTTNDLYSIKFFNYNLGMCVGNAGTVLFSSDGGGNWVAKSSGTTNDLKAVTFSNSNTVWIAGSGGKILSTSDLGNNWISYDAVTTNNLTSLSFINQNTGWIGGMNGTMFKYSTEPIPSIMLTSPNGGDIWKSGWQRNITWTSENISNVNLYFSTNGGGDWNTIATNIDASSGSYNWTIPILTWFINLNCKVKIEDASNSSFYDESDNNFIIWHFCNIIQYANLGQRIIDFLETNIDITLNVTTSDNISVTYYPYETPTGGTLPSGIVVLSDYYWQVTSTNLIFSNGKMIVPISTLRGVTDASKLVWLKRTNPGDDWENIGGIVTGNNLESTVLFNSFSEFAIGSTDPANPLPVELYSFEGTVGGTSINLKWKTKTEVKNYGFEIERSLNNSWERIGFVQGHGNSNSPKSYSFIDNNPFGGSKFLYRLKQIDTDGQFEYSKEIEVDFTPSKFTLYQNYPNPFNPITIIEFSLPEDVANVKLSIYNALGEKVAELVNTALTAGRYSYQWNAENIATGIYIYELRTEKFISIKKMILLR